MSDIKQVIRLLCKHLNFLFDVDVKPEHFRLAKFNKTDDNVAQVLWDLLNKLTINADANQNIKNYLKNLEYTNGDFYKLLEDAAPNVSTSRELLITVCFLVCKNLDRAIADEIKLSAFHPDFKLIQNPDQNASGSSVDQQLNGRKFRNKHDRTQFADWIENKTVLNRRMARDYEEQNKKLLKKLLAVWSCPDVWAAKNNLLSINETLALNSDRYCKIFMEKSSRVLQILENHKCWLAKEALFWQWMETVLLEKTKDYSL